MKLAASALGKMKFPGHLCPAGLLGLIAACRYWFECVLVCDRVKLDVQDRKEVKVLKENK